MAAFEEIATACGFDVGLLYSISFSIRLSPSQSHTYQEPFLTWTEYIHYDIYSAGWK